MEYKRIRIVLLGAVPAALSAVIVAGSLASAATTHSSGVRVAARAQRHAATSPHVTAAVSPPVSPQLIASFATMRRGRASADDLSAGAQNFAASAIAEFSLLTADSRLIAKTPENTAWLVPGPQQSCLVDMQADDTPGTIACMLTAQLPTDGLTVIRGNGSVVALLPDGASAVDIASASGAQQTVSPNADGAVTTRVAAGVASVSYGTPAGAKVRLSGSP